MPPGYRDSSSKNKGKGRGPLHRAESSYRSRDHSAYPMGTTRGEIVNDFEPVPNEYDNNEDDDDDRRRRGNPRKPRTVYEEERSSKGSTASTSTVTAGNYETASSARDSRTRRSVADIHEDDPSPPAGGFYTERPAASAPVPKVTDNDGAARLDKVLQDFVNYELTEYKLMAKYIDTHQRVLNEDTTEVQKAATRAYHTGDEDFADRCLQRVLLLYNCKKLGVDGAYRFVRGLAKDDSAFVAEFRDLQQAQQQQAALSSASPPEARLAPIAEMRDLSVRSSARPAAKGRTNGNDQATEQSFQSDSRRTGTFSQSQHYPLNSENLSRQPKGFSYEASRHGNGSRPSQSAINLSSLHESYRVQSNPRKFFVRGRVFKVLWHQPAGANLGGQGADAKATSTGMYGEPIYTALRWMLVVAEGPGYCICCPISTYGHKGLATKKFNASEIQAHAIMYASGSDPEACPGEPVLKKTGIPVDLASGGACIDPASRVHFGKLHTVEHNVKVAGIGNVPDAYISDIVNYAVNELRLSMGLLKRT